jgi:excinuclease ABC subunit A
VRPGRRSTSPYYTQTLEAICKHYGFDEDPWNELPEKVQDVILFGTGEEEIDFVYDDGCARYKTDEAVRRRDPNIERRWRETDSQWVREELSRFQSNRALRGL